MDKIREKIIEICLSTEFEDYDLIMALEQQVALINPYDHREEISDFEACGLTKSAVSVVVKSEKSATMSQIVEQLESSVTKRELAVGFFKQLFEDGKISQVHQDGSSIQNIDDQESYQDFVEGIMGSKPPKGMKEMLDMFTAMSKSQEDDEDYDDIPSSPKNCRQEDNSECWKCPHKGRCSKFSN